MGAPGAVEELEIRLKRLSASRQADGDTTFHLVEVQRTPERLTSHQLNSVAG